MPIFTLRDFNCVFCQSTFEMLAGDIMIPEPDLCEDCLKEVWEMDDEALTIHFTLHLSLDAAFSAEEVVQHTQRIQEQSESPEQAIQARKSLLKGLG
jgi:hypothetical protein